LRAWVTQEHGVSVSHAVMWETLGRLGLTLKKSAFVLPNRNAQTSPRRASLSVNLCGACSTSLCDEALAEDDGELGSSSIPFTRRHFPILADLAQDEEH